MNAASPSALFPTLLKRELLLLLRNRADWVNPLMFALASTMLFPLALGPELRMLALIAGSLVWVIVLLASLMSLESIFRADLEDGSCEYLVATGHSLSLYVAAKTGAHWLGTGLPLGLIAPLLALLLGFAHGDVSMLVATLWLGTLILAIVGACCAALTAGIKRSGLLLTLLVLPLISPVLIFGSGAAFAAQQGIAATQPLLFLLAYLALLLPIAPHLGAYGLRLNLD